MFGDLASAIADVAVGVLVVAGLIKLIDPVSWVAAVRQLGVPLSRRGPWAPLARLVGLGEVAIGAAVLLLGGRSSFGVLALAYVAFAVVSLRALRVGSASCGCFGASSAPITTTHVVANLVGAAAALVSAVSRPTSLVDRLDHGLGASIAYLVFVVIAVGVTIVALTTGAELTSVRRTVRSRSAGAPRTVAR